MQTVKTEINQCTQAHTHAWHCLLCRGLCVSNGNLRSWVSLVSEPLWSNLKRLMHADWLRPCASWPMGNQNHRQLQGTLHGGWLSLLGVLGAFLRQAGKHSRCSHACRRQHQCCYGVWEEGAFFLLCFVISQPSIPFKSHDGFTLAEHMLCVLCISLCMHLCFRISWSKLKDPSCKMCCLP